MRRNYSEVSYVCTFWQKSVVSLLTSGPHLNGCTDIPLLYRARCNPREMEVLPASLDGAAMMNLLFISSCLWCSVCMSVCMFLRGVGDRTTVYPRSC